MIGGIYTELVAGVHCNGLLISELIVVKDKRFNLQTYNTKWNLFHCYAADA